MNRRPSAFDPFNVSKEDTQQQQEKVLHTTSQNENRTEFTFQQPSESSTTTTPSNHSPPSFSQNGDLGWPQDPAWSSAISGTGPNNMLSFQATNPAVTPATTPTRNKQLLDITATTTSTNTSLDSSSLNYSSQDSSNNNNNISGDSQQIQVALMNALQNSNNNNKNDNATGQQQQQQHDFNVFPENNEGVPANNINADTSITPSRKVKNHQQHQSPQLQTRLKRSAATATATTMNTSPQTTTSSKKSISTSQTTSAMALDMKVEERLSIYLDDTTSAPTCRVIGTISMNPSSLSQSSKSFILIVRDRKSTIERWEEQQDICKNITSSIANNLLDSDDQVFRILSNGSNSNNPHQQQQQQQFHKRLSINGSEGSNIGIPILAYRCHSNLKPIPVLVKTKVIRKEDRCRVGIRFRANPSNGYQLQDVSIVMVVPPDIDGEGVSISRKGGVWDVMKRTLSWIIPELSAGEVIDIQAQFKCQPLPPNQPQQHPPTPNFPVLVQCNGNTNFSKIQLEAQLSSSEVGSSSGESDPVELKIEKIANVLYRKV